EPTGNGIGGDAFALVWDKGELRGLNGSGRSPRGWTLDYFSKYAEMPVYGWDTVTVPGAVDVWATLSDRFGRLPFADLFKPAISYARNGFLVSPITARAWALAAQTYVEFENFTDAFVPGGRAPRAGERFCSKAQATTLESIAESRGESFYRGELAERIAAHATTTGGAIRMEDLAEHGSQWVEPLSQDYQGVTVHEIPPNGQGLVALMALSMLEHLELTRYPVDSADSVHLQVEAIKVAFALGFRHIAEPSTMTRPSEELLDEGFLREQARNIRLDRTVSPPPVPVENGTVYLTTADSSGMMVSFIQSNFHGFGSGIVVPDTGISLQNRGSGFNLEPGHPNCVGPGKRPFHTIIPGFVTRNREAVMSFGVMGGHMQPQGHVQMMVRIFGYGQNPQSASDAPRWHVTKDFDLALEPGVDSQVKQSLRERGHKVLEGEPVSLYGGAQAIYRLPDGYCGASDHRKDGLALGY
ncbi:MAG: gamma-glutamyltransferase family protein, partial [Gammaproteobacteria bacterium]|nr:gamma-glutamyltransferase family protein [Gammaproteobacteria bacterium]